MSEIMASTLMFEIVSKEKSGERDLASHGNEELYKEITTRVTRRRNDSLHREDVCSDEVIMC